MPAAIGLVAGAVGSFFTAAVGLSGLAAAVVKVGISFGIAALTKPKKT